ncbi:MAG TPA: PEP-CTERM sorting domain-containing protein [Myxococcota bacterium]|nr:PEP-CTERM sorting domain-containing protein [Myxococcota bacterium]
MRTVAGLLCLGLVWGAGVSAQAMSIAPDPVTEVRTSGAPGGSLSASLQEVSISGNQAVFQLSVAAGSITGIDVGMLLNSLGSPTAFDFVTGASFGAGSGIGGTASVAAGGTQAQFDYSSAVGVGAASRSLIVTFASAVPVGYFGSVNFDNGYVTTKTYSIVPEPGALALLGFALASAAFARRRSA